MKEKKEKLNIIFASCGIAMVIVILTVLIYTYIKSSEDHFYMTKQEFAAITDDDELLEAAFFWTENYCPIINSSKKFNSAAKPIKNIQAMLHLDAEVLNGGFPQFYYNGYAEYGFDYVSAFQDAKLYDIADLVNEANKYFESIKHTMPDNKSDIDSFLKWYGNKQLSAFDNAYADKQLEIRDKIVLYIRQNIEYLGD